MLARRLNAGASDAGRPAILLDARGRVHHYGARSF